MKQIIKNNAVAFLALLLFAGIFYSCKKQEIKGPQGDPGVNGTGGNSNISNSNVFVVDSSAWQKSADGLYWETNISQPLISQNIIDKGAVKVYMQLSGFWWALPYAIADNVTQFAFKAGVLHITVIDVEGGLPLKPATNNYRLVVLSEAP